MKAYLLLAVAIAAELFGTSMLKATEGFTKPLPGIGVIIGFGLSFYCLSLSLQFIPLSIAYAIWSGVGTAITAAIGVVIWKEQISIYTVLGILLIIGGVILLNLKSPVDTH
ncbi:DMT family transporter [Peribacillus glennii]|uniref:QacE family quaternary ammonium compound efflux SMR transporter n=1 Tax=Peribacillus glennii TaxID=2303991 RepID=A0A372L763_9BACI|nr:multidrug efflux SMR transporter [Peribacillus glennii]RFU61049.1 QacE family quaternary ammonium compound efflux SMR transporter [Peribacillus glennii]